VRERVREFIEALISAELDTALARPRYGRAKKDEITESLGRRLSRFGGYSRMSRESWMFERPLALHKDMMLSASSSH
jgi:hypothetical protein